jgi:hypothetical protein
MENSFYDLDYIIGIGEKRVDLYLSAYQGVLGRLTNIILIYSAIGIYFIPIIQDIINGSNPYYILFTLIFMAMTVISVINTIRLLIPVKVAYLELSDRYSTQLRQRYEEKFFSPDMPDDKRKETQHLIDTYLKASYIDELSHAQETNQNLFVGKNSLYYRALIWGLAAIIPYVVCIGFHLLRKDDKVQKVHLVYVKNVVNYSQLM